MTIVVVAPDVLDVVVLAHVASSTSNMAAAWPTAHVLLSFASSLATSSANCLPLKRVVVASISASTSTLACHKEAIGTKLT